MLGCRARFLRSFLRRLAMARRTSPPAAFSKSLTATVIAAMIVYKRVAHIKTRMWVNSAHSAAAGKLRCVFQEPALNLTGCKLKLNLRSLKRRPKTREESVEPRPCANFRVTPWERSTTWKQKASTNKAMTKIFDSGCENNLPRIYRTNLMKIYEPQDTILHQSPYCI